MDIIKSLEWRYACKKFDKSKKLNDEQLNTIKNAFNLTATSFGLQPLKMVLSILLARSPCMRILGGVLLQKKLWIRSFLLPG